MRTSAAAVLAFAIAAPVSAAEIEGRSSIDAVTVYPDGATVTRVIRADLVSGDTTLIARDFPLSLDPGSLRVEGEGGFTIGSVDVRPPRPEQPATHPEAEARLEKLRDERAMVEDAINAATARKKFIERFAASVPLGLGDKGDARPLSEWRAAFAAVTEELAVVDQSLREARLKARDLDRQIARVQADLKVSPARKLEVRIDLNAREPGAAVFRVSYTVRGARWTPVYDARLDSRANAAKPAIEIVRRAEVVQQTGEDWDNVTLAVSTVRTAKGGNAPDLRPLIVRFHEKRERAASTPQYAPAPAAPVRGGGGAPKAQEQEAEVDTSGLQAIFRIPGRVTLPSHEGAKALRIGSATLDAELLVRAAPAVDETGFIEASFKHAEDAPLLAGRVAIYRDGVFVGRGVMPSTPKDETVRLGFGADERVKITRQLVRKTEGQTGVFTSSKVDEREFKITVRNGHARPIRIQIEDQIPVSEQQDVVVEILPATTPPTARDVRDRRGVLAWTFEAKPGESKEIKLAWRVRWPADKAVVYGALSR